MKKLSFILISLILCVSLTSCSAFGIAQKVTLPYSPSADSLKSPEMPSVELPSVPEAIDFEIYDTFDPVGALSKMYAYNYNDQYITVATSRQDSSFITGSGLFLDNCVYERNSTLETSLHFKFSALNEKDTETIIKNLETAQKNRTKYTSVFAIPLSDVSLFDGKDVLYKVSSLPFMGNADSYEINNSTALLENDYFILSEASILPSRTRVVFFNTTLMKTASIKKADPYTLISSKAWTWEALEKYISKTHPLVTSDDVSALVNATILEASEENTAKAAKIIEKIAASTEKFDDPKKNFLNGNALMYIGTLADIAEISESDIDFGILPIPVFEEGDNYSDLHSASDVTVYAVPKGVNDAEEAAFIISAIAECSAGSRTNAFAQILESKMLTTNGARLAFGYIFTADIKIIY